MNTLTDIHSSKIMAIQALLQKKTSTEMVNKHLEKKRKKLTFKEAATAMKALSAITSPTRKAQMKQKSRIKVRELKNYKKKEENHLLDYQKLKMDPLANVFEGKHNNYFSIFKQLWQENEKRKAVAHLNKSILQQWRDISLEVVLYASRLAAFFHESTNEISKAKTYIEFAYAKGKQPDDYLRLAYYAYYERDYQRVYDHCDSNELSEHPMAYFLIADMIVEGLIELPMIEEDEYAFYHAKEKVFYRYAVHYYQLALALSTIQETKNPLPALAIGKLYLSGKVPSTFNEQSTQTPVHETAESNMGIAISYLQMAESADSDEASFMLGYMYGKGKGGLMMDIKKSRSYLKKAVRLSSYLPAIFLLALNYHHGWDDSSYGRSTRRALYYYALGAQHGHVACMTNYGYCLMQQGDFINGFRFFQKAAAAGDARALYNVARILRVGLQSPSGHILIPRQPQASIQFLRKAAAAQNPSALHDLAVYLSLDGAPLDHHIESKMLLQLAASKHSASKKTRSLFSSLQEKDHLREQELLSLLKNPDSFHKVSPLPLGTNTSSSHFTNVSLMDPKLDLDLRPYLPSSPLSLFNLPSLPVVDDDDDNVS